MKWFQLMLSWLQPIVPEKDFHAISLKSWNYSDFPVAFRNYTKTRIQYYPNLKITFHQTTQAVMNNNRIMIYAHRKDIARQYRIDVKQAFSLPIKTVYGVHTLRIHRIPGLITPNRISSRPLWNNIRNMYAYIIIPRNLKKNTRRFGESGWWR